MSERAVLPDIGKTDQDPMSEVGYPTRVVGFHGLFGCKPHDLSTVQVASNSTPAKTRPRDLRLFPLAVFFVFYFFESRDLHATSKPTAKTHGQDCPASLLNGQRGV